MGVSANREPGIIARGPWQAADIACSWSDRPFDGGAAAEAEADAAIAALAERGSPTHDGLAARLAGVAAAAGRLELELEPVRWSIRLGDDAFDSLSALCVVRDSEGRWLAGRRAAWVATWAGRWALGAGGTVEVGENPAVTLERELREEWSVVPERLSAEVLIRIPSGLVLFVGLAHLEPGAEVTMDAEHDEYAWWPPDPDDWPAHADPPLRFVAKLLARAD
jgi:ADP-ribose pyrophosphatase YjhB (NUDIX family)